MTIADSIACEIFRPNRDAKCWSWLEDAVKRKRRHSGQVSRYCAVRLAAAASPRRWYGRVLLAQQFWWLTVANVQLTLALTMESPATKDSTLDRCGTTLA